MTRRLAFRMKLLPGASAEEYKRRHDEIWPELAALLKASGVSDYSIFLDRESGTLFAFQRVEGDGGSQDLGTEEVVRRWWDHMADLMETEEDKSPVSVPLEEVFRLD